MREVTPEPDFDRLWQEMEERSAELERQLLGRPRLPVYGVLEPHLRDGAVGETSSSGGVLDMVQLVWGGYASADSRPAMAVRTAVRVDGRPVWGTEDLARTLADERARRLGERDADALEPVMIEQFRAHVVVDALWVAADVRVEDECWAALLALGAGRDVASAGPQLLVCARWVALEDVRLGRIADLAPYVRNARRLMHRALVRARRPADGSH